MSTPVTVPVDPAFAARARLDADGAARLRERAARDPDGVWRELASRLEWMRAPTEIRDVSFDRDDFRIRWYADGELNASVSCLDRHLDARGDRTALIVEPDDPAGEAQRVAEPADARGDRTALIVEPDDPAGELAPDAVGIARRALAQAGGAVGIEAGTGGEGGIDRDGLGRRHGGLRRGTPQCAAAPPGLTARRVAPYATRAPVRARKAARRTRPT